MTVNQFSSIKRNHHIFVSFLILLFCSLPVQHRFKRIFRSLFHSLVPNDLLIPSYFSKSIYFYLADPLLLLFLVCFFYYRRPSVRSLLWEGPTKFLSLLFITGLVSIAFSQAGHYPLQYIRLAQLFSVFLLFGVLVNKASLLDIPEVIKAIAWILLGIGCLETGMAIVQYFTQGVIGLHFLGEIHPSRFPFPSAGSSLYWGGAPLDSSTLYRACGTFSHPNILGTFLFCSILATSYLYLREAKKIISALLLSLLSLQVLALFTSFSRSALLGLGTGCLFFFIILFKKKQRIKRLSLLLLVWVFSCLGSGAFLSPALLSRGGILNYEGVVREADLERIAYAQVAIKMIKQYPLLGVGFNNFQLYSQQMTTSGLHSKVHNIYLLIASEMGLIGFGLFFLFLFYILRSAFKGLFSTSLLFEEKIFSLSAFLGLLLIGSCDFFIFSLPAASILFFSVAALLYTSASRSRG